MLKVLANKKQTTIKTINPVSQLKQTRASIKKKLNLNKNKFNKQKSQLVLRTIVHTCVYVYCDVIMLHPVN